MKVGARSGTPCRVPMPSSVPMLHDDSPRREPRPAARDARSLDELFREHGRDVYRIVRRLLGPRATEADVEDLTQQVFFLAHRDRDRFRGESAPSTWLYSVASHAVLTHFRGLRRRQRFLGSLTQIMRVGLRGAPDPEAVASDRQDLDRAARCLERLSPEKRVVFVLFELEGLSGRQIAEALDLKESTVWTRLHHARREIVDAMKDEGAP
jgi:RNA polymerase sigma-70 factor (ECF subfamily)